MRPLSTKNRNAVPADSARRGSAARCTISQSPERADRDEPHAMIGPNAVPTRAGAEALDREQAASSTTTVIGTIML